MLLRLTIFLAEHEFEGLKALCKRSMRMPRDQVRFTLREELVRSGCMPEPRLASNPRGDLRGRDEPSNDRTEY
jgi:hypothetical protein